MKSPATTAEVIPQKLMHLQMADIGLPKWLRRKIGKYGQQLRVLPQRDDGVRIE